MKTLLRIVAITSLLSLSHMTISAELENETKVSQSNIPQNFPKRPEPIIELGNEFLGTGALSEGFEIFTGAVWQPSFLVFGTYRSALQTQDNGVNKTTEWANRLDLFGNLYLTPTERILIGFRPLDKDGVFTGYQFDANGASDEERNTNGTNNDITTLFFEGDFGELFPGLDRWDTKGLDIGFSIGRQPISFQEGIMINDFIDAIGITQNSLRPPGINNLRITALYGWDKINRSNNLESETAELYGLFTEMDFAFNTVAIDLAFVDDDISDASFIGLSSVQRFNQLNTAFRLLGSSAKTDGAEADTGSLIFIETSWTRTHSDDLIYINLFSANDQFSSVARDPSVGGPLGRAGILFAAPGIGTVGSALSNQASDVFGGAIGFQTFLGPMYSTRKQLIIEVGFRQGTDGLDLSDSALGARYMHALGQHYVLQLDTYVADYEGANRGSGYGARAEFLAKF